jgi:hypothetical protein
MFRSCDYERFVGVQNWSFGEKTGHKLETYFKVRSEL